VTSYVTSIRHVQVAIVAFFDADDKPVATNRLNDGHCLGRGLVEDDPPTSLQGAIASATIAVLGRTRPGEEVVFAFLRSCQLPVPTDGADDNVEETHVDNSVVASWHLQQAEVAPADCQDCTDGVRNLNPRKVIAGWLFCR
jgi:hypothetical protein